MTAQGSIPAHDTELGENRSGIQEISDMNALGTGLGPPLLGKGGTRARFVTPCELARLVGLQAPTIYRYIRNGILPEPDIRLASMMAWHSDKIDAWRAEMAALPANATDKQKAKAARKASHDVFGKNGECFE